MDYKKKYHKKRINRLLIGILLLFGAVTIKAQESIVTKNRVEIEETRSLEGFAHPGIGCNAETLNNLREGVLNGQSPWVDYFIGLRRSKFAGPNVRMQRCERIENNGNIAAFASDAQLAWTQAILYIVTGKEEYRKIPLELIKWYGTRENFFPRAFPDSHIKLGKCVYTFCTAVEIMRYTIPANKELAVTNEMVENFEKSSIRPIRKTILENKGYFMNQHTYSMIGYMAAAILADDREGYEDAVEMATVNKDAPNQGINGSIKAVCRWIEQDDATGRPVKPHVQLVEMGRDEAHAFGNVDNLNQITRMIDLQGTKIDPVSGQVTSKPDGVRSSSFLDNRILAAAEYFSRYNMGYGVEWTPVFASTGRNPAIYPAISPEYRGRIEMNAYPALYYRFRGLGCDFSQYPALYASALKAIQAQKERVASGEFINTLHNDHFDLFIGLDKAAAVGTPDLQKAQQALAIEVPPYKSVPKGVHQIEDYFVDLSALPIEDAICPRSADDLPIETKVEAGRSYVRMTLHKGLPRTMVNLAGSLNCPVGKTGILLRSSAPVRIDLHNGEQYDGKHPAMTSLYVPDTENEWRYVVFERNPKVITNSMFGFSTLLYFNVQPMEKEAVVDFDLFNSNEEEIRPIPLNIQTSIVRLSVCPGETIEKRFQEEFISDLSVTYLGQGIPKGASFDSKNGLFCWTPSKNDKGMHRMYVTVQNGTSIRMIPIEIYVDTKKEVISHITRTYVPQTTQYVSKSQKELETALMVAHKAKRGRTTEAFSRLQEAMDNLQLLSPWLLGEEGSLDYTQTSTSSRGLNIFVYSNGDNYDCSGIFGPDKSFVLDFGEDFKVRTDAFGMQPRANFPDRVKGTVVLGSNDLQHWNELTKYPAGVGETIQRIPVKEEEREKAYRYLKIYMPDKKGLPGLLDLGEFRIYGERIEKRFID